MAERARRLRCGRASTNVAARDGGGDAMLEIDELAKSYGSVEALRGVDLEVGAGEIVGLLGPNGAGKTTLVSIVAGLRRPDRGRVRVGGIDAVADPRRVRQDLGIAPQELGVYPLQTVRENLTYFGRLAGLRRRLLQTRVDDVAERLRLTGLLDRRVRHLSGGEKRRVHTGMALVHRPRMLILDEPTTGVDVQTRADVLLAVRDLAAEGSAVCYATHYLAEVESLDATVAILDRGRVIARDTVAALVADHAETVVELAFDGKPPALAVDEPVERDGHLLRVATEHPSATVARLLQALGEEEARLTAVEIVRPSLESVFLALTGRRYAAGDDTGDDAGDDAGPDHRDVGDPARSEVAG
jgi:ABC-2 type transport system ATP-binding protein